MNTFNFGVTVNFGPDTLQAVNRFLDALNSNGAAPAKTNGAEKKATKADGELPDFQPLKQKPNGQAAAKAVTVTLEQLREKFSAFKDDKAKRPKCAAILKECGVTSVSNIPVEMYAEVYEKINQL